MLGDEIDKDRHIHIVACARDRPMEFQIGLDRLRRSLTVVEALQRRPYLRKMLAAAAGGCKPRRFNFEDRAQLEQVREKRAVAQISASSLRAEFPDCPGRTPQIPDVARPRLQTAAARPPRGRRCGSRRRFQRVRARSQPVAHLESSGEDLVRDHTRNLRGEFGARPSVLIARPSAALRRGRPVVGAAVMKRISQRQASAASPDGCQDRSRERDRGCAALRSRPQRQCDRSA